MRIVLFLALAVFGMSTAFAEDLTADQKAKVDAKLALFAAWGSDPAVVKFVKAAEASPPTWAAGMTQDKWTALSVLSPEIKELTKNDLAAWIRSKKDDGVTEVFVSSNTGIKIAFLAKSSNWSHKGKPKHDVPMTGKTWVGAIEADASTGQKQVQVSFPVLDGGKVLGSIVVGLSLSKL
jgi:hypothetical protein